MKTHYGPALLAALAGAPALAGTVTISQFNGTGYAQHSWSGPTATYVELHNISGTTADLTGWAIQNAISATGSTWFVRAIPAGFTIAPHGYALIVLGQPATPNASPNDPGDVCGFIPLGDAILTGSTPSALGGKIALTNSTVALTGLCPSSDPSVVDFLGYGNANCAEGPNPAPTMSLSDGQSLYRGCLGNTDTGVNANDFSLALSSPRNSQWETDLGVLTASGAPTMASAPSVVQNTPVLLTASASSCAGAPTGVSINADLSFVGGPATQPMFDNGTHGDATPGDGIFSLAYTVPDSLLPAPPPGPAINRPWVVPMTAIDSLGRTAHAFGAFHVTAAPTGACCISGQSVSVRTQASCAAAGGTYRGDGSPPFSAPGAVYTAPNWSTVPNNGSAPNTISIPDATAVNELVVHLTSSAGYLGNLTCTLTKGATTVTLFERVGVAGSNATGRPGDLIYDDQLPDNRYHFYNKGASFWNAAYNGGKDTTYHEPWGWYAPSGSQNAASSFAPFIGASAQGDWTLSVASVNDVNNACSFTWSLEINPVSACPAVCYPNCDASTTAPVLNVADFSCFLQKFASGVAYANCDLSTQTPTLNVADFSCFLQKYAGGCP